MLTMFYWLALDECTTAQLAIVMRRIDNELAILEKLLALCPLKDTAQ